MPADVSFPLSAVQLDEAQRQHIRDALIRWYRAGHRDLPWRRTGDPYAIWISEIMLQQTRVDTVRDYYARFMARFPTIQALAAAPIHDVLELWSGLGYYARARNLHAAACQIAEQYAGAFPRDPQAVHALPGIGPYTAGAILSIAYGARAPILDGNVTRVLSRLCAIPAGPDRTDAKRLYWRLAEELLPQPSVSGNDVGDFNQALMELGATVCTPQRPVCLVCPLNTQCQARREGEPERFPPPKAARPVPIIHAVTALVLQGRATHNVLLLRRPPAGLWGGLWEPPTLWLDPDESPAAGLSRLLRARVGLPVTARALSAAHPLPPFRHVLTHREIRFTPFLLRTALRDPARLSLLDGYEAARYVDATAPLRLGLSAWVSALLSRIPQSDAAIPASTSNDHTDGT